MVYIIFVYGQFKTKIWLYAAHSSYVHSKLSRNSYLWMYYQYKIIKTDQTVRHLCLWRHVIPSDSLPDLPRRPDHIWRSRINDLQDLGLRMCMTKTGSNFWITVMSIRDRSKITFGRTKTRLLCTETGFVFYFGYCCKIIYISLKIHDISFI